jgi:hypothetical protein
MHAEGRDCTILPASCNYEVGTLLEYLESSLRFMGKVYFWMQYVCHWSDYTYSVAETCRKVAEVLLGL